MPAFLATTLSTIGSGVSSLFSTLLPAIGSGISSVFSTLLPAIGGGLSSIFGGLTGVAQSAFSLLMNGIATGLRAVAGLIGAAITGFTGALRVSVSSLLDYADKVASIRDQTGMGIGDAHQLTNRFQSMGIKPGETASIFGGREMAPQMFGARARAVGAPDLSLPDFGPRLAAWFQAGAKKGVNGFLAQRAKLDALFGGQAPASILRMVNQKPEVLQRELKYGAEVQQKMGISSGDVERASSEFPLLINRIMSFVEAVKLKFASEMLPTLEVVFGTISSLFISNASGIGSAFERAGEWMFTKAPGLALGAAETLLNWGESIVNIFFGVVDAGLELMRSFGNAEGPIFKVLMMGATFIDFISNFGRDVATGLEYVRVQIGNALATWQDFTPGGAALREMGILDFQHEDPIAAAQKVAAEYGPPSGARDGLTKFAADFKQSDLVDRAQAAVDTKRKQAADVIQGGRTILKDAQTESNNLSLRYQKEMLEHTKRIADGTDKTVDAIKDKDKEGRPLMTGERVLNDIGTRFAERATRMNRRRG